MSRENVITGIVEREEAKLHEPLACSKECHDGWPYDHAPDCPAHEDTRLREYGLAVAKAVVEQAADLVENGQYSRTMFHDVRYSLGKQIRALAAPRTDEEKPNG